MKTVITGPTGSIGANLIIRLLEKPENEIWAICNPSSTRVNLLPKDDRLHIIYCDIHSLNTCIDLLSPKLDTFIHLGWCGTGSARRNTEIQLENINCYRQAINVAKALGCSTFVGAGSQAEYGQKSVPITEDMCCNPETAYGVTKLGVNHISALLCREAGIRFIWPRYFSIYGPYENFSSLTSSTIIKYLNKETPDFTEGIQMWDYAYAGDAALAVIALIENTSCSGIYNISSGRRRPLRDYITEIAKLCGAECVGNFGSIPYTSDSVMYLCGDISKLKKDTGCMMDTPFDIGIAHMIDWIKSVIQPC